jgi:hypothetical protein
MEGPAMKRKGIVMTAAQAEAHQTKHGFRGVIAEAKGVPAKVFQPKSRLNKTETDFSNRLEAQKRAGEINEWRFGSIKLAWGEDPETGKPMFYTADFSVWKDAGPDVLFIEVKNNYIHPKDWIRFKGARARWPRYHFELHQKREGQWTRLL